MKGVREAGFTVVEISLFLGISALLFTIALIGTGSTVRTVRFLDSGRSLEAYVQKQYDEIVNGVNPHLTGDTCTGGTVSSGSQAPGTSNCLLLGKLLVFTLNSFKVATYYIVGTEPVNVSLAGSDEQLVIDYAPKVIPSNNVSTYEIPWQAFASGFKRLSDSQGTNALALIRSPKSTRILAYTYKEPSATPSANLLPVVTSAASRNKTTNFCIKHADGLGNGAKLVVTPTATQNAVDIVFDVADTECNGV